MSTAQDINEITGALWSNNEQDQKSYVFITADLQTIITVVVYLDVL